MSSAGGRPEGGPSPGGQLAEGPARALPTRLAEVQPFLQRLLSLMGIEATVKEPFPTGDGRSFQVDIATDDTALVVGRKGANLDALQLVVNRFLGRSGEDGAVVVLDCGGYRQRRRQGLEEMAARLARKALSTGRILRVGGMLPADRRIVHLAIGRIPGVTSRSEGSGADRWLLVVPLLQGEAAAPRVPSGAGRPGRHRGPGAL